MQSFGKIRVYGEKKISPEKMKQYKEDYQIARMAYMEELGKDCDRIPPDFWKDNGFDR